jgi:hypothetical protein
MGVLHIMSEKVRLTFAFAFLTIAALIYIFKVPH